jgi:hypothetical protein
VVDVTYVLFAKVKNGLPEFAYLGSDQARANLRGYLQKLLVADVLPSVAAIYPIDEPDRNVISPDMCRVVHDVREVLAEFHLSIPLAVIYGAGETNGIECFNWIGRDSYPNGPQTLPLLPGQRLMIVAGGADPYREKPDQYEAFANSHPEVVAVIAFAWFDYSEGSGIGHNGMLPAYKAMGCRLTAKC